MTLKELSIELGKPTHVLANTLRQVGLAEYLLYDSDTLSAQQINRLRLSGKRSQAKNPHTEKYVSYAEGSIGALAEKLGRPLADMINIIKMSSLMDNENLYPETSIAPHIAAKIEEKLSGIRICKLADELGVNKKNLAEKLCKIGIIPTTNWNQKINKRLETEIRKIFSAHTEVEQDTLQNDEEYQALIEWQELKDLHERLDELENQEIEFEYDDYNDMYDDEESAEPNDKKVLEDEDGDVYDKNYKQWAKDWDEYCKSEDFTAETNDEELLDPEDELWKDPDRAKFIHDYKKYTLSMLSDELQMPEDRVRRIIMSLPNGSVSDDRYIATELYEYVVWANHLKEISSFEEALKVFLEKYDLSSWLDSIENAPSSQETYSPGKVVEGKITGYVQYPIEGWEIEFEQKPHISALFTTFFQNLKDANNSKIYGFLPVSELDWELWRHCKNFPDFGNTIRVLITGKNEDVLKLSHRLTMRCPKIDSKTTGRFIDDFDQFVGFRAENGAIGLIPKISLLIFYKWNAKWEYELWRDDWWTYLSSPELNTPSNLYVHPLDTYEIKNSGQLTKFYKLGLYDDSLRLKNERYIRLLHGLSDPNVDQVAKITDWGDFVDAYEDDRLILAKITDTNDGGYLMTALENDDAFELFCPYKKGPTLIDPNFKDDLIGTTWVVKIVSDPDDEENNNTIVSAKLNRDDYIDFVEVSSYYEAIVCNINDSGANLLIDGMIPVFLPNSLVSWKEGASAISDLKLGEKLVIKLLTNFKDDKGIIASARDATIDPWKCVSNMYPVNTVVDAKVVKKEKQHVFLAIGDYSGYLSAKKISWMETVEDCSTLDLPEHIRVLISGHDDKFHSIIVSLRDLTPDPWTELDKHLPEDGIINATVTALTRVGAWLKVGELGFKGYLSYRDVDWCRYVDQDSFPHAVNDKIEVKITKRNTIRRMLTCSMKALKPNPWKELEGMENVFGTVTVFHPEYSEVRLDCGIECVCRETLEKDSEGQRLSFDILHLDVAAQQVIISHRKQEIVEVNTMAVGEMFKKYRRVSSDSKCLLAEGDSENPVYGYFTVKGVSSTGRVTAVYAGEDGEYENGVLLPGNITCKGKPVNIIFARRITKEHIKPGSTLAFRITHRYDGMDYAVLSLDVAELLDLGHISTNDLSYLSTNRGVEATVLHNLCTQRNIFVEWRGYFGYMPMAEFENVGQEIPDKIRVKAIEEPLHPEQMIHFVTVSADEEQGEAENQKTMDDVSKQLETDLLDCYRVVNSLDGFNPRMPEYYPYALQLRYDPAQNASLEEFLAADPTYFSSQTFFLDCYERGNGYVVTIFNKEISINGFCIPKGDDGDIIRVNSCSLNQENTGSKGAHYGKPIKIYGENIQVLPQHSSAPIPDCQDVDILMLLIKYVREVIPQLQKLSRSSLAKRGEHYLTLQELLKMEKKREENLSKTDIKIPSRPLRETTGDLGGMCFEFEAGADTFDSIRSMDDKEGVTRVLVKPNDGQQFNEKEKNCARGELKYLGHHQWRIDLFKNQNLDQDEVSKCGLQVKRLANLKHLERQICAIDNFVYERYGLDIFTKIQHGKLIPVTPPSIIDIEANPHFNLSDEDDSQANALKMALGGSQLTLIQGPPGTGKSTVIVDIIRNLVKEHKKILVCTQSVAPVEELYFKVSGRRKGIQEGTPVKVGSYDIRCAYLRDENSIEKTGGVKQRLNSLKGMRLLLDKLKKVNSSPDREADEALNKAKEYFEPEHKDDCKKVVSRYGKDLHDQYDALQKILGEYLTALDRKDVEDFVSDNPSTLNLEAVDVVFGTCIGVGVSNYLKDVHFDVLIIDEAGKANYAESLVPMMMADEYILVGDDKQLPPYTNSELVEQLAEKRLVEALNANVENAGDLSIDSFKEAIMEDVGNSLFGDLRPKLPVSNQVMLSKQFRMHPEIGDFVSKLFYEGKVESVPTAAERSINIRGLEHPIKFIDTSKMGFEARESRQGSSIYNDGEILAIEQEILPILKEAVNAGKKVGILSPYGAQVERLRKRLHGFEKSIFTIDSIQGEEYDIVVFSFVRNTRTGTLNFVDDLRRLNVSFSRAKCNLIMVGHLDTLNNESLHQKDREAVLAVYKEIEKKNVSVVAYHGAMQKLFDDFPPFESPLIHDLDHPYHVFDLCKTGKSGQFTAMYNGKMISLYNPLLKKSPAEFMHKNFKVSLIGYLEDESTYKPLTMVEPMGLWLQKGCNLKEFEFSGEVYAMEQDSLTLRLADQSLISLKVPAHIAVGLAVGVKVRVSVHHNKFTITQSSND